MSITHVDLMLAWFRGRGNTATLREILDSREPWSYEFRARLVDARTKGLITGWECDETKAKISKLRTDNVYRIIEAKLAPVTFCHEPNGQRAFA